VEGHLIDAVVPRAKASRRCAWWRSPCPPVASPASSTN
jgi:hypothetical protein